VAITTAGAVSGPEVVTSFHAALTRSMWSTGVESRSVSW